MKKIRRIVFLLALISLVASVVLLMNITAPNPTGRRYSSAMPLIQGNSQAIGKSAESILANDLDLPSNNDSGQQLCVCTSKYDSASNMCKVCLAQIQSFSDDITFRRPDFVGADFIAESKNVDGLVYTGREGDQIMDYVSAALVLKRPLWVYVRVGTSVAETFLYPVRLTGGDVVYYFTVPGYVDPVDSAAQKGLLASGAMVVGMGWLEWRYLRRRVRVVMVDIPAGKPSPTRPVNTISRKLDHAEDFAEKSKDRLRGQMDNDDVWGDEA